MRKLLIVENHKDMGELLQFNLLSEGYKIEMVRNAEEGMKRRLMNFDLILLDIGFSDPSGWAMAEEIGKIKNQNVSLCIISDKKDETEILKSFQIGADDYISKPFSINELLARIKAILNRYPIRNSAGNT